MKWKNEYSLGISLLDAQHKQLFRLSDQLDADLEKGVRAGEVEEMLVHLGEYAARHFAMEEKYMEEVSYPGLDEQRKIHQYFISNFTGMYENFQENGLTQEVVQSLRRDLTNWIRDHVTGIDQLFGVYCKNRE